MSYFVSKEMIMKTLDAYKVFNLIPDIGSKKKAVLIDIITAEEGSPIERACFTFNFDTTKHSITKQSIKEKGFFNALIDYAKGEKVTKIGYEEVCFSFIDKIEENTINYNHRIRHYIISVDGTESGLMEKCENALKSNNLR